MTTINQTIINIPEISDEDILDAMKHISGYLDITPGDFKNIYQLAYHHAIDRLTLAITAKHIMTMRVVTFQKDTPLIEAAVRMAKEGVSGAPVVDEHNKLVGIISEKDFMMRMGNYKAQSFMEVIAHCLTHQGCSAAPIKEGKVQDIMRSPVVVVEQDASLKDIALIFAEKNIRRLPVVDGEYRLIGIITKRDIVQSPLFRLKGSLV
jgi:CBS domain-containing protein